MAVRQQAAGNEPTRKVDDAIVTAFRQGDESAFGRISELYFRELHVHCYRMVGSFEDAEDLVQETLLRAWRNRDSYEGRGGAPIRAWLYRIATNVCIDDLRKRPERAVPAGSGAAPGYAEMPWLQPYPDDLLDSAAPGADQPDARLTSRESIDLAFLASIQRLPAKQRAALILRDVLEFSANETAEVLEDTTAAVNSALQRARSALRDSGAPSKRGASGDEFGDAVFDTFLDFYTQSLERGDIDAIIKLLRDDIRMTLLPEGLTWSGAEEVACEFRKREQDFGDVRNLPLAANRQPAMAVYRREPGGTRYQPWAIVLLGVVDGKLSEIATFASPNLFSRFNLPAAL